MRLPPAVPVVAAVLPWVTVLPWVAVLAVAALLSVGCRPHPMSGMARLPPGREGLVAWRTAHAELAELREVFGPQAPYTMNVALTLDQPHLAKRIRARGAIAVRPPNALRMILLGPGGTTALDLWICGSEFRFAVPAIDLLRRGDATTPAAELRGLPVDFLRWWFLRPLAGRLLAFVDEPPVGRRYLLSDGDQVVELRGTRPGLGPLDGRWSVQRRSIGDEESLLIDGDLCGKVHYRQRTTGIDLEVQCEKLNVAPPPPRAFVDPDDSNRGCGWSEGGSAPASDRGGASR